jgi:hypothetical protein
VSASAPGAPPHGSIWIVCDLRVESDAELAAFERRVLAGSHSHSNRFWTTPPLRPSQAVFELNEAVYGAERVAIDTWMREQPELANPRVVRPISG